MTFSAEEFDNHCISLKRLLLRRIFNEKSLSAALLTTVIFPKALSKIPNFLECKMVASNFSLVQLDGCRLQDCVFENCKLVGVNFAKCEKLFLSLKFKKCLMDTCNFSDLDLKGTQFLDCHIRHTHFTQTNLSEAVFTGSDLQGSLFHNSDLRKANFQGAQNYSINPLTNKLLKAKFSKPEVMTLLDHLGNFNRLDLSRPFGDRLDRSFFRAAEPMNKSA